MIDALLPSRPRRSVNLTPLIDVVFILLMFFMLTSTFNQWRSIELLTPAASEAPSAKAPSILLLDANGLLRLDGSQTPAGHFRDLDKDSFSMLKGDNPLVIVPAADASVQVMVSTMEILQELGFSRVTLGNVAGSQGAIEVENAHVQ